MTPRLVDRGHERFTLWRGSGSAAPRPMIPASAKTIIAAAYEVLPRPDTRMVPATAVPRDEPRLEMQRDKPEISPCWFSANADCTTLTDGVSMTPTPRPRSR